MGFGVCTVDGTLLFVEDSVCVVGILGDRSAELDAGFTELDTLIQIAELAKIVPNITTLRAASLFLFTVLFTIT